MNYEQNDWSLLQEDVTAPNKWATKTTCIVLNLIWIEITGFDSEDTDNIIPSPALVYNNLKYCLFPVVRWLLKQFDLLVNFSYFYLPIEHSFISLINRSEIFIELLLHFASGGFVSRQHFLLRAWLMMSAVNLKAQLFRLMQRKSTHLSPNFCNWCRRSSTNDLPSTIWIIYLQRSFFIFMLTHILNSFHLLGFKLSIVIYWHEMQVWNDPLVCGLSLESWDSCFQSYSRNPARGT